MEKVEKTSTLLFEKASFDSLCTLLILPDHIYFLKQFLNEQPFCHLGLLLHLLEYVPLLRFLLITISFSLPWFFFSCQADLSFFLRSKWFALASFFLKLSPFHWEWDCCCLDTSGNNTMVRFVNGRIHSKSFQKKVSEH